MNKTKIDWADYTWNPVTGCKHDCSYCYARKMSARFSGDVRLNKTSEQCQCDNGLYVLEKPFMTRTNRALNYPFGFEPTLHKYRFDWPEKVKNGRNIFVCSMADLFGSWVPDEWIEMVFNACDKYSQHNYMFLTKKPGRYSELYNTGRLVKRDNMWYGFSVTNNGNEGFGAEGYNTFVSVEPLLEDLEYFNIANFPIANWVIIGAETGNRKNKVIPKIEWIKKILAHCNKYKIPVFMKESLIPIVGQDNMIQEFPEKLKHQRGVDTQKDSAWYKLNYDKCCFCKEEIPKKGNIALLARGKRGTGAKHLGYVCQDCFNIFCENLEIDPPEIEL